MRGNAKVSLAVVALAIAVAACGQRESAALIAEGTPDAAQRILHRGNVGDPSTLDPQRSGDHYSGEILRDLFEGLVGEAADGRLEPGVAREWTISADGLVYTFTLRDDARWSDRSPVQAEDFVRAIRTAADPATAGPAADLLRPIAGARDVLEGTAAPSTIGVRAISARVLEIRLAMPTGYFLSLLTHPIYSPRHRSADATDSHAAYRISNGPFIFQSWVPNDHVEVRRNPEHRDAGRIALDAVRYYSIGAETDEFLRYRAGELDLTSGVPVAQLPSIRRERPAELHMSPYLGSYFIGFNLRRGPFSRDADLRRALSLAIDRDVLAERVLQGTQLPAWTLVPAGNPSYPRLEPAAARQAREERLALAREMYARAAASQDEPLRLRVIYGNSELVRSALVAIGAMWKEAFGIELEVVTEEFRVFLDTQKSPEDWDLVRMAWVADFNDPIAFLHIFRSDDPNNVFGYESAQYDDLLARAETTVDAAARMALLAQAEQLLLDDAAFVPLFHMQSKRMVSPRVTGFQVTPLNRTYSRHLGIEPTAASAKSASDAP